MGLVLTIGLRNLLRQKRRSILLGAAISLGVMILVVANSFSNGITDILLNKIVSRVAGHIQIAFNEKGSLTRQIFRDRERLLSIVKSNVEGIREVEEAIGVFGRAIGNGRGDNVVFVGIDLTEQLSEETRKEIEESFRMLEGDFTDLASTDVENPVILSEEKAKYLNVKKGDILRLRFTNIFGGDDTARATLIGIMRNDNVFMQTVMFTELGNLKRLMGYRPFEVSNINITLKDPKKNAVLYADKLHDVLTPGLAVIYGDVGYGTPSPQGRGIKTSSATVLGFKSDETALLSDNIEVIAGEKEKISSKDAVIVSEALAGSLGIRPGDDFKLTYKNNFEGKPVEVKYTASAVFRNKSMSDKNIILIAEREFYDAYYDELPGDAGKGAYIPGKDDPIYKALATEWILLDRTMTTDELRKKIKDISRGRWRGTTVDVRTMYESASDVLKLEDVLNLITISAVLILFVIILIGIVNTLRMAIRERTREIGTTRAIGMQKSDVRNTFIMESLFLSVFASALGIALAFLVMHVLSQLSFDMRDNPMSILLVNGHLYFKPSLSGIAANVAFILAVVAITAYFPARRAANLPPSAALRHYE